MDLFTWCLPLSSSLVLKYHKPDKILLSISLNGSTGKRAQKARRKEFRFPFGQDLSSMKGKSKVKHEFLAKNSDGARL
jgi:hypothetical protein